MRGKKGSCLVVASLITEPGEIYPSLETNEILTWSDAASTKGLGAFYLHPGELHPQPRAASSIPLPRQLAQPRKHINTQEMRAVEQVLLHWGSQWKEIKVIAHETTRQSHMG